MKRFFDTARSVLFNEAPEPFSNAQLNFAARFLADRIHPKLQETQTEGVHKFSHGALKSALHAKLLKAMRGDFPNPGPEFGHKHYWVGATLHKAGPDVGACVSVRIANAFGDGALYLNDSGGVVFEEKGEQSIYRHLFQDKAVRHAPYLTLEAAAKMPAVTAYVRHVQLGETRRGSGPFADLVDEPVRLVTIMGDTPRITPDLITNFSALAKARGGAAPESRMYKAFASANGQKRDDGAYAYVYEKQPAVRVYVQDTGPLRVFTADADYQSGNGVFHEIPKGTRFYIEDGKIRRLNGDFDHVIPEQDYAPLEADPDAFSPFTEIHRNKPAAALQ